MIRVTVELVSALGRGGDRVLGVAEIANDLQRTQATDGARGAYNVRLSKMAPKTKEVWKRGRVEDFDRRRRGSWDLLYLALRNIVGKRNGIEVESMIEELKEWQLATFP